MSSALFVNLTSADDPPPQDPPPQEICPTTSQPVLAFEGAMGWAKYAFSDPPPIYSPGNPILVTNGDDYDPATEQPIEGSLRYAIEELAFPRLIKVLYNGEINLKARLELSNQSFVKITGEYATDCASVNECGPTVTGNEFRIYNCNNIIVRYMRFRSGIHAPNHCARSLLISGEVTGCNDIIIDHCSIGASRDDNLSVHGKVCRLTIQNCIIGGAVKGLSFAGIGSEPVPGTASQHDTLTYCRNLITNTRDRQLYFCGPDRVDFFNNVVSIGRSQLTLGAKDGTNGPKINIINNFFRTCNNPLLGDENGLYHEDPIRARVVDDPVAPNQGYLPKSTNEESIHISGNVLKRYKWKTDEWEQPYSNQWDMTFDFENNAEHEDPPSGQANYPTVLQRTNAWTMPEGDTIEDAEDVEDIVLADAGCRLPTSQPALDDYDQELVDSAPGGRRLFPEPSAENDGNPGTTVLVSPAHEATGVATALALYWLPSDETDCYLVAIDTSNPPSFNSQCMLNPCCSTPTDCCTPAPQIQVTLDSGTTYYWQVLSRDSCGHFSYSAIRSFTTGS